MSGNKKRILQNDVEMQEENSSDNEESENSDVDDQDIYTGNEVSYNLITISLKSV